LHFYCSQKEKYIIEKLLQNLKSLNVTFSIGPYDKQHPYMNKIEIIGSKEKKLMVLGILQMAKNQNFDINKFGQVREYEAMKIKSIVPYGKETIWGLGVDCETYIVDGFGSHNTHFDIPFLRTRCIKHGIPFPEYQDLYISDVYYMVKNKLQLHRNRLENACQFFDIPSKEHRLNPDTWNKAGAGDTESLEYIWEHNKEDVIALEQLHRLLENYTKKSKVSI
jgi:hypothetical protein